MRFSLTKIFQVLFRLLLIFSLIFIWARYYSNNLNFAIWVSIILTFCAEFFLQALKRARNKKQGIKQREEEDVDIAINRLIFNTKTQNLNFFFNLLKEQEKVTKHKNLLVVENQDSQKFAFVPMFSFSQLEADDLIEILQKVKSFKTDRVIICTKQASKQAKDLAKAHRTPVLILEKQSVYTKLLKAYNQFPPEDDWLSKNAFTQNRITLKDIAKNAISPNKTKSYFFSSLVLLVATYFVPYNIYYLIFASFLLLLSLASFSSTWWKKPQKENVF